MQQLLLGRGVGVQVQSPGCNRTFGGTETLQAEGTGELQAGQGKALFVTVAAAPRKRCCRRGRPVDRWYRWVGIESN